MATVYAHTNDGWVAMDGFVSSVPDWSTARTATSGNTYSSTTTTNSVGTAAAKVVGRGGTVYIIYRSFFFFDTSGITDNVGSATLKLMGYYGTDGDCMALKSTSDIETLGTADFNAIVGWSTTTDGSGGGDNESNVTKYSDEITTWTSSGTYNDITLNSNALADMKNDDTLYICLINYDHDLKDIAPTAFTNRNGMYYSNYTGTSRDPYIDYTLAPAVTDNATFFGANF